MSDNLWISSDEAAHEEPAVAHAALVGDILAAVAEEQALDAMLARCSEALVRRLGAAFARVWTLDAAPGVLELQASAGMYRHLDGEHSHVPVGEFKIGRIAEELAPHLTNHVLHDPRISDHDWARREGMVASPATRCWPATSWSACWPCSPATSSPSDVVVAAQEKLAGANEAEIDAEFRKREQQHETRQIVEEVAQAKADAERRVTHA